MYLFLLDMGSLLSKVLDLVFSLTFLLLYKLK